MKPPLINRKGLPTLCLCSSAPLLLPSLRIITYFQIHSILTNKAKVKSAKINVSSFATSIYVQVGHLVIQTNKAKTKPIQTQFKPKQTQFKPKQTQFKANFTTLNGANRLPLCPECLILWSLANIKFRIKGVVK